MLQGEGEGEGEGEREEKELIIFLIFIIRHGLSSLCLPEERDEIKVLKKFLIHCMRCALIRDLAAWIALHCSQGLGLGFSVLQ